MDGECYEFKRKEELYFTFRMVDICIVYFLYIKLFTLSIFPVISLLMYMEETEDIKFKSNLYED